MFAQRDAYVRRDRFASIGEADDFYTKIVGVSFEGRQNVVAGLLPGNALALVREPDNLHDANAVAVRFGLLHLGYLRREIAHRLAANLDRGDRYAASVGSITGGGARHVGVNIRVQRERQRRTAIEQHPSGGRTAVSDDALREALIGGRPLRDAQRRVLERLEEQRRTLAVLGTGRGKSLCFQLPAARATLEHGSKTLVFYPLRALANDQYDALVRRLEPLGVRIFRANGAIDGAERADLEAALEDGSWDVMLTTPEFATFHRAAFLRRENHATFVVVDEAHHLFESRHRPAYGTLGSFIRELAPQRLLALTATANADAFAAIRTALGIESWVIDPTVRENLHVVDARNTAERAAYLVRELDDSGKAIVYGNSRSEVTKLAERLRARLGPVVAFYHAGLPSAQRAMVEDLFRAGSVRIVVATSAFGEGIDLPDVRDVVLYHLNFHFTEFNQMAGRAGRDGAAARIHLLYGDSDRRINDFIIGRSAPSVQTLRELYRGMRAMASDDVLRTNYEDIARTLTLEGADGSTVGAAVRIFEEANLVAGGVDDGGRFIRFSMVDGKVDLTKTARYAEGQAERDNFERFCALALEADAATLEQIINRPIYPDRTPLER
ncbi:MAG: DEAD/DEAH box helicase [Candidatus Eremiobacteraeota bacterium]|nr:DEAD/DEAH box helicase [Candidatus Eremiobacteraeota bacterium]MBC5803787.1 DEAD/DEAH box helicase [Candidatus Eremiobacteraeota bacterium]MBC5821059.1 DEAD/DEAH box helicase [Candidatus Eremiobacteraeota bacterium]